MSLLENDLDFFSFNKIVMYILCVKNDIYDNSKHKWNRGSCSYFPYKFWFLMNEENIPK